MPTTIVEGSLQFEFPEGWKASKFDEWSFYRNQFARVGDAEMRCNREGCGGIVECASCGRKRVAGTKGVDILALSPDSACWLIEIKDYRSTRETDFAFLADTVALKVRDTLACLAAARWNANDEAERKQATAALAAPRSRIVLHLEVPAGGRALFASSTRRANVLNRLKQLVKSVDPHPLVVSRSDNRRVPWTVSSLGSRR
jgi:hypothetical protein